MSGGATGQYAVLGASGEEGQSASAAQYKAGLARKAGAGNHSAYNTLKPTIISVHDFMHPGTGRVVQIITMQDAKVREGSWERSESKAICVPSSAHRIHAAPSTVGRLGRARCAPHLPCLAPCACQQHHHAPYPRWCRTLWIILI